MSFKKNAAPKKPYSRNVIIEYCDEGNVFISGNTYPIREDLKTEGAQWIIETKEWKFSNKNYVDIQNLITSISQDQIVVRKKGSVNESSIEFQLIDENLPSKKKVIKKHK